MKTGPNHPLGEGHEVIILESDHRGGSGIVIKHLPGFTTINFYYINMLDGKPIQCEHIPRSRARKLAAECDKSLGY